MPNLLASLDLAGAPAGRIFDSRDPDTSVEDKYFQGWRLPLTPHKYWKRASPFVIDAEEGHTILECLQPRDAALLTGNQDWADYTVSARVRLISDFVSPDEDHPDNTEARAGLVARYQTSRHYYFFALTSTGRAVFYRRADGDWHVLAETPLALDRRRYYSLTLCVQGNRLKAAIDGRLTLEAVDDRYPSGPAGIRTRGRARFGSVQIHAAPEEEQGQARRRASRLSREKEIQAKYPKEKLLVRYSKPEWEHEMTAFCRIGPGGSWGFLMYNSVSVFSALFARTYSTKNPARVGVSDLQGNLLWGRDLDIRFPFAHDANGDGRAEILGIVGDRMVLLAPDDGRVLVEAPLPLSCPFQGHRGVPVDPDLFPWYPADLQGTGKRQDFLFKDDRDSHGGRTLWAYDNRLRLLWTARTSHPRYGHALSACDINGDGRTEILAGIHCFDSDGKLLWNCSEADMNDDDHIDEAHLGLFGPNGEPRACGTNGNDGFFLLDGLTGEVIARHRLGHVQGVSVGNYLPDRPGKDYCVGSRWGSFGILNIIDASGRVVTTWEPDNVSQGGPPVRWTGDGRDLIFLSSSTEAFGLWDGFGNRCVALECPELPFKGFYGIQKGQGAVVDVDHDGSDELVFSFPGEALVYKAMA